MRLFLACFIASALVGSGMARAEDPPFVPWSSNLPPITAGYDPNSDNICTAGKDQCVHAVIREMDRRFDKLGCDHDAVFALTYLRTTEEYHRFWHEPGSFDDKGWLNHYDAVFASYFFKPMDDWKAGRTSAVPPAWRVALDASDRKLVSGSGSMFLGMNAHIQRDLPFVLYSIGLKAPDGTSRKLDHDRVNQFLNRVADTLLPELARRFDPTISSGEDDGVYDDFATFQLIPTWREEAWRNAERLANARTSAERASVAQQIEAAGESAARSMVAAYAYGPLNSSTAAQRDQWCAVHHDDA